MLVYELHASYGQDKKNLLWALCHTDQILRYSFNPFRYWLFRYFGIISSMDDAIQKQLLNTRIDELIKIIDDAELAGELDRVRSVLGALLDLHWTDSFYATLDAESRYNNTLTALITLIKAESLRQPILLFIEGAQFLDDDSKAFLPRLKRALTAENIEYPVALLVSSRYVGADAFLTADLVDQSIELGPLSTQALFSLAEIYLGGVASPDLVRLLEARSEGNPYFAEQILIYLQEEKLLEMSSKGWRITRSLQEASLPADIRALLVARLDQLTRNVREIIQTAAVLGREFEVHVLAAMLQDDNTIAEQVAQAEKADIWSAVNQIRYIFTHGLLRDAAYSMQMRARRMELHAIAVEALEKVYADEVEHHYGELAYHAEHARLTEKALYYLRSAGKVSADAYQNSLAVDYFTRALVFVNPDDLITQYDLVTERVELFSRLGKRDLQLRDLNFLEQWAQQLGDADRLAKARMLRSVYYCLTGEYLDSIEYAKSSDIDSVFNTNTELVLSTQIVWSQALVRLGRLEEAMQRAQIGLARDRAMGNRKQVGRMLTGMGLIALEQKESAAAQKYFVEAMEIAREVKDPSLEVRALNNLALCEGSVNGNYALAREYFERSYKLAHQIGDRTAEGFTLANLGFSAGMQGDLIAARSYHEQSLFVAREIGNPYYEIYTLINLSALAGIQNDAHLALEYAKQAELLSQKTSERVGEAWALLYMGHAYLLQGELGLAQPAYHKSIEIRNEMGQLALSMEPLAGLVEMHLKANDLEAASNPAEKIMEFLQNGSPLDGTDEPLRVYFACYQFLEKKQDQRSRQLLRDAMQLLETQVSNFSDEISRERYIENIPWRRALREASHSQAIL